LSISERLEVDSSESPNLCEESRNPLTDHKNQPSTSKTYKGQGHKKLLLETESANENGTAQDEAKGLLVQKVTSLVEKLWKRLILQ